MGKTLTFWMPLLFQPPSSVIIVVTPLNGLGKQNVASLDEAGLKSIFICGDTATAENFRVSEGDITLPKWLLTDPVFGLISEVVTNLFLDNCI